MANKANRYCAKYPCNRFAVNGAYCQEHTPARAPKETDPFYLSVQWRRFREYYIGLHPLCEQCLIEGRETPAAMTDHILSIADGGALTSEDNAMSLCWKCHGIKTAAQARNRGENPQLSYADNRVGPQTRTY